MVQHCSYPLTAAACVTRVYTDLAVVDITADGFSVREIAAAAVDVLSTEPPVDGDPLLDYDGPNLILTPHIAWATATARQHAIDELTANTRAFIEGRERNRIV